MKAARAEIDELKLRSKEYLESISSLRNEKENLEKDIEAYREEGKLKDEEIQDYRNS